MDLTTLYLPLILLLITMCGLIVVVPVLIGGVIWLMRRNVKAAMPPPAQQSPDGFFAEKMPTLRAWDRSVFADLSNRWVGWWHRGLGSEQAISQGVIQSLREPGTGWIAFTLERSTFRSGVLRLRTSANEVVLTIRGGGQFDQAAEVDVTFDNEPLGRVRLPDGAIFDSSGQQIGTYTRRTFAVRTLHYNSLTLHGQPVAAITDIWIRQPHATRRPDPAMQSAENVSADHERWLLAVLGVELYYDALWERKRD